MNRIIASLLAIVATVSSSGEQHATPASPAKPNIILILIDDQDKSSIGAYGGNAYTPSLDRMAAEGMKFTQAYVSSAVCTPSRYSFLTGRYAGNSTSRLYNEACGGTGHQGRPGFNVALERDHMNVGAALRAGGYATGFVGKFHLESESDYPEFHQGSDGFRSVPRDLAPGPAATELFAHNERVLRRLIESLGFSWVKNVYSGNLQDPYAHHNPEWTLAAALEFIETHRDRPFFLHYAPTLLHGPPASWRRSMDQPLVSGEGQLESLPSTMTPRAELLQRVAEAGLDPNSGSAGEAWIDDSIGAMFAKLKDLGLDKNTLVVFAPDHGRRGKSSLFTQDGVGIPLIARWPDRIPAGSICDELVLNVDWVPTVFEAAGLVPPDGYRIDGRSFLPLLEGRPEANVRDHVYLEMGHARGVATKEWKYIAVRYPQEQLAAIKRAKPAELPREMSYIGRLGIGVRGAERAGFWDEDQLYDLRNDPDERINLAADSRFAEQLAHMRRLLATELQRGSRPFGEFSPGGNAAPGGQIDRQIALVKTLTIRGKTVVVPDDDTGDQPSLSSRRQQRRAEPAAKNSNP